MERAQRTAQRRLLLAGDGVVVLLSMLAAWALHGLLRPRLPVLQVPPSFSDYALLTYLALPMWLSLVLLFRLDRSQEQGDGWVAVLVRLLGMHGAGLVAIAVLQFVTQSVINRSLVLLFLAASFTLMATERLLLARWRALQHQTGTGRLNLLLVGAPNAELVAFARAAARDPLPARLVGYLGPQPEGNPLADLPPRLGTLSELEQVLQRQPVDQVVFFPPHHAPEAAGQALATLESFGATASFPLRPLGSLQARPRMTELYGSPFVSFEVSPKPAEALALKHALDLLAALGGLLVLSPLLLLLAAAVLVAMGRPVLFVQERVGLNGRRFRMLKFRTMVAGAEELRPGLLERNETGGAAFKMADDPRVTRLGRFLRRTSFDELPQLLNVARGSMSLVGPRPLPVGEQSEIQGPQRRRLSMKPGITGLWQVSGRSDLGFEEWMRLDLVYIDTWSLALDARILLKTLPAVLLARGSR